MLAFQLQTTRYSQEIHPFETAQIYKMLILERYTFYHAQNGETLAMTMAIKSSLVEDTPVRIPPERMFGV